MTDIKNILNDITGMQLAKSRMWESLPKNDLVSSTNRWQEKNKGIGDCFRLKRFKRHSKVTKWMDCFEHYFEYWLDIRWY